MKIITLVFNDLTIRPLVLHHLCVIFRAFSIRSLRVVRKCPLATIAMSSAQPQTWKPSLCKSSNQSFTMRLHNSWYRAPPCGQPLCGVHSTVLFLWQTVRSLPANIFSLQSMSASGISCLIMVCLTAIFEVLSKAPSISKKAPMAYSLASSCFSNLLTRWFNAVSVDLGDSQWMLNQWSCFEKPINQSLQSFKEEGC